MKNKKGLVSVAVGLGLMGFALAAPAHADTNDGVAGALVGVGSDTSQDVIEGFSTALDGVNPAGLTVTNPNSYKISNYKATGTAVIDPKGVAACTTTSRPNGSGAGLNALSASIGGLSGTSAFGATNFKNCVDFARSSSGGNPTVTPGSGGTGQLTYVPFAVDEITYATLTTSSIPPNLDKTALKALYAASGTPGTAACSNLFPLLPQSSSGTRKTFLTSYLGFTATDIGVAGGPGTCVRDTNIGAGTLGTGTALEENDGRVLSSGKNLIPYSVGVFIAQGSGITDDIRGRASLGSVDGSNAGVQGAAPYQINPSGVYNRLLYNAIPTETVGQTGTIDGFDATKLNAVFAGSSSLLCSADGQKVVNAYGFGSIPSSGPAFTALGSLACGATTKVNSN